MKARDGWISVVTLVLALASAAGMAWSDQYPLAARAEVDGFDALAHGMFGGLTKAVPEACQNTDLPKVAQQ